MLTKRDYEFDEVPHTDKEIRDYISMKIPNISPDDLKYIRDKYIYECKYPLDVYIHLYTEELKMKEYQKRKDKKYYWVSMYNGGKKVVYMCEEQVKEFYGHYKEV